MKPKILLSYETSNHHRSDKRNIIDSVKLLKAVTCLK